MLKYMWRTLLERGAILGGLGFEERKRLLEQIRVEFARKIIEAWVSADFFGNVDDTRMHIRPALGRHLDWPLT